MEIALGRSSTYQEAIILQVFILFIQVVIVLIILEETFVASSSTCHYRVSWNLWKSSWLVLRSSSKTSIVYWSSQVAAIELRLVIVVGELRSCVRWSMIVPILLLLIHKYPLLVFKGHLVVVLVMMSLHTCMHCLIYTSSLSKTLRTPRHLIMHVTYATTGWHWVLIHWNTLRGLIFKKFI
jgi:hypothetical protein